MASFSVGEIVEAKDKNDEKWYTGKVFSLNPLMVQLGDTGQAYAWDEVRKLNIFKDRGQSKDGAKNGDEGIDIEEHQYKLSDVPPGLSEEDANKYPRILARANSRFALKYLLMAAMLPFLFNTSWLALGNVVNDGNGLQNLNWYVFFFDFYFMLVKGTMISAYFYVLMPVTPGQSYIVHVFHCLLFPIMNSIIHAVWQAADVVHTDDTWILMKLNFPIGASLALFTSMPIYIFTQYPKAPSIPWSDWKQLISGGGPRFFAFKRYLILVIVLVGDLFFISSSHIYVFYFFEYQKGKIVQVENSMMQKLVEILWIVGFSQVYMPMLGKIWQFAILLIDKLAPMDDLQRQRLLYFATVILDMHRIMYARQIFTGLKAYEIFVLAVLKDATYDFYHFGVKALPPYQAMLLTISQAGKGDNMQFFTRKAFDRIALCIKCYADLLDLPKKLLAAFHWNMNGGGKPGCGENVLFFVNDSAVHIKDVPNSFDNTFVEWVAKGGAQAGGQAATEPSNFDECHAKAIIQVAADEGAEWNFLKGNFKEPTKVAFYEYITLQLGGLVYNRYRVRGAIRLASSVSFLLTGAVIRHTPSGEVMNMVRDHSVQKPTKLWLFGVIFFITDLITIGLCSMCQNYGFVKNQYKYRRFARMFESNVYLLMILSCHVCCNSDVFLTFANLEFGRS